MKDIARRVGVCTATVSLALRNHPSIPEGTQKRIQLYAKKIGYTPHPFVSALMAERRRVKKNDLKAIIAILSPYQQSEIQLNPFLLRFHQTAHDYARSRGFNLELHCVAGLSDEGEALYRMLSHRGVSGIILCDFIDQQHSFSLSAFEWNRFCVVHYGYHSKIPPFHRVHHHVVQPFRTLLQEIQMRGFIRPGLLMNETLSRLSQNYWSMTLRDWYFTEKKENWHFLYLEDTEEKKIRKWIAQSKIDLLLTIDPPLWIRGLTTVPWVNLNETSCKGHFIGIWNNYEAVAQSAINLLEGLLIRNEKGIPENPCEILSFAKVLLNST